MGKKQKFYITFLWTFALWNLLFLFLWIDWWGDMLWFIFILAFIGGGIGSQIPIKYKSIYVSIGIVSTVIFISITEYSFLLTLFLLSPND